MKKLIEISALMLLLAVTQSCSDDILKTRPSRSVGQDAALGTPAGVKAVRASMYTSLFSFAYNTGYMVAPSALADGLFHAVGNTRFIGKNVNATEQTVDFWEPSYNIIQKANLLIHAVDENVLEGDLLTQFRAEAYFMRAFAEHNLARSYGYEPNQIPDFGQSAGFNLSIVIRTEAVLSPEDIEFKSRATIEETYKQIESDLLKSIELFKQVDEADLPRYASQAAAEALLARVYLYWEKYDLADQYATAALQHTDASLADPSEIGSLFYDPSTTIEVIFRAFIADPQNAVFDPGDNGKATYTSLQYVAQVPTQDQLDLYSSNDARLAWFRPCFNELANSIASGCRATHPAIPSNRFGRNEKQGLELGKWDGSLSNNVSDHIPYFRVPEMLLIQAEARLKGATGSALVPINKLRASRGLQPIDSFGPNDPALYPGLEVPGMEYILKARRREFIGEGQRFWDLKRLGLDIRKAPATLDQFGVNPVPYNSFRILSKIPEDLVIVSQERAPEPKQIKQNPGY